MISLSNADIGLILLYVALVVYVGFRSSRKKTGSTVDFLLAGRSLTLPMFVATLVSTWYGGILGIGEFSYQYGISNWIVFGLPYYVFAFLFAMTIAKKIRATNLVTIPDKLHQAYDAKTSLFGALLIFLLTTPAPYILMLGVLVQLMFGVSLPLSIFLSTGLTIVYLFSGGFRSDVYANIVEFILMFVGIGIILPFAYFKFGGVDFLRTHLPPLHLTWHGGNTFQYIVVWFFIALWTLIDPSFHQRCYAAKDPATAKRGILVSILFWFVFDFLTSSAGLYARAALPNLRQPVFAYPMLAEATLPSVAKGIFYIGMLATIMSTLSSFSFISATVIGNDVVGRVLMHETEELRRNAVQVWTKIGLFVTGFMGIGLSLWIPSVVQLWYVIGTCIIPGLLVPLMASYFERFRITTPFAFAAMTTGFFTSTGWLIAGYITTHRAFFGIEPMYPGLILSVFIWGIGNRFGKKTASTKI